MTIRHWIAIAVLVGVFSTGTSSALAAQRRSDVTIAAGSTVRVMVTERPPGKVVGAFVGDDSSAVHVIQRATGATVAVDWSKVRSIEVRRGRRTAMEAFGRGAKAGALVAGSIAVAGIATAIVWDARGGCEGVEYCIPASAVAIPMGYLATVAGTALGGSLGLLNRDRWRTAWPEGR